MKMGSLFEGGIDLVGRVRRSSADDWQTFPGVGATYDRHEYEAEKRDALTRWDAKLAEILA